MPYKNHNSSNLPNIKVLDKISSILSESLMKIPVGLIDFWIKYFTIKLKSLILIIKVFNNVNQNLTKDAIYTNMKKQVFALQLSYLQ